MSSSSPVAGEHPAIRIDRHVGADRGRSLADDVREGFARPLKELPPKHFYDSRGSELFERICEQPEYYPTRAERAILAEQAGAIVARAAASELVELGSGSTAKARLLLDAMSAQGGALRYVAVDVSERMVREAATELVRDYDGLEVHGVVADFERHLRRVPGSRDGRLVALLGGTIGNLLPAARRRLLGEVAGLLGPGDHLLLGTDLVKDRAVIEAAYNDRAGVTAEFNRNILHVVNRGLGGDFRPERFDHVAFFDAEHEWVEMRLRSQDDCTVRLAALDLSIRFAAGEELRTEVSAKFTRERIEEDYAAAGLRLAGWYTDVEGLFAVSLARRAAG